MTEAPVVGQNEYTEPATTRMTDSVQGAIDQGGFSKRKIVRPSRVLLTWKAPERLFKKKSREFYRKIIVIIIFFMLLLLIIKEFILIALLAVFFFVVYVFHTIPPKTIQHEITTNGINYASEHKYSWTELDSFFIEKKDGVNILNVNTVKTFPGRLFMILGDEVSSAEVSELLNRYISVTENPELTMMDKMVSAISKRINI